MSSLQERVFLLVWLLFLLGARTAIGQIPAEDPRQVPQGKLLVEIRFEDDYQQLEELAARFEAEVVRFESPHLYLLVDENLLASLREEGYEPRLPDPEEFFEQLVRVEPPSDSLIRRVQEIGGHLIQREEAYAVFRVNLKQLKLMQREELQVRKIQEGELVPRFVEIAAPDESAVALVVSLGVDIFEVREGTILGRAYDAQIESLTQHGLEVRVVPQPFR